MLHLHCDIHRLKNPVGPGLLGQMSGALGAFAGARPPHGLSSILTLWTACAYVGDYGRIGVRENSSAEETATFGSRITLSDSAAAEGGLHDACVSFWVRELYLIRETGSDETGVEAGKNVVKRR